MRNFTRRASSTYIDQLRRSYGDLSTPKRLFVLDAARRRPFESVVRDLSELCDVEDDTDVNYDVCFTFILECPPPLIVKLSMVGPYAVVLSFGDDGFSVKGRLISPEDRTESSGIINRVFTTVGAAGFAFVPPEELEAAVPIAFTDKASEASLYAALFEPEGEIPWLGRD